MTEKGAIERLKYLKDDIRRNKIKACDLISEEGKYNLADDIETVLNMLKEKDAEIEKLKQALARNIAKNFTSIMKESSKSKEDLEMLNAGWQIELEKKDKIIDLMATFIDAQNTRMLEDEYTAIKNIYTIIGFDKDKEGIKQYFERKVKE